MRREDLEHLIRAASRITDEYDIVVIGSQAILGSVPNPPDILVVSLEADLYPMNAPGKSDDIDGAIGEGSRFHEEHSFYAQGVGPETAVLPRGWKERLVRLQNENTDQRTGWCLEVHDLAVSKLVAMRHKDSVFVTTMIDHDIVDPNVLLDRIRQLPESDRIDERRRTALINWVARASEASRHLKFRATPRNR